MLNGGLTLTKYVHQKLKNKRASVVNQYYNHLIKTATEFALL